MTFSSSPRKVSYDADQRTIARAAEPGTSISTPFGFLCVGATFLYSATSMVAADDGEGPQVPQAKPLKKRKQKSLWAMTVDSLIFGAFTFVSTIAGYTEFSIGAIRAAVLSAASAFLLQVMVQRGIKRF